MLFRRIIQCIIAFSILCNVCGVCENTVLGDPVFEREHTTSSAHELAWIVEDYTRGDKFYILSYNMNNKTLSRSLLSLPGFNKADGNRAYLLPYRGSESGKRVLVYSKKSPTAYLFMINNEVHEIGQIQELDIDDATIPRVQEDRLIYTTAEGTCSEISLNGEITGHTYDYPLYSMNSLGDAVIVIEGENESGTTGLPDFEEFLKKTPGNRVCVIDKNNAINEIMCVGQEDEYSELVSWNWCNDRTLLLLLRRNEDPTRIDLYKYDNNTKACFPLKDPNGESLYIAGERRIEIYDIIYCDSKGSNMAYIKFDDDDTGMHSIIVKSLITGDSSVIYSELDDNTEIQFPASLVWYD